MMLKICAAAFIVGCGTATAGEFDGYCFEPDADGISQKIQLDRWDNMEGSCSMANPVAVRGMDAILYDVTCSGDWGKRENRVFFLKLNEGNKAIVADEFGVSELSRCDAITLPSSASELSAFDRMVLEELSCVRPPRPTEILQSLIEANKIDVADNIGYDSMSCWKIERGISIAGMTFQSVCAFEEDEQIRSLSKALYYRGPGTSPGQRISFGSAVNGDQLSDWYIRVFGPSKVSSAISEGGKTTLQDPSEVSCTSWMQDP